MKTQEIVEKYYSSFNKKDWDAMLALLSPDVAHEINQGQTEIGRELFKKFLLGMDAHYSEKVTDLVIFSDKSGTRAAAEFFIDGIYHTSQAPYPPAKNQKYRLRIGTFFELKSDLITRVTAYYNFPRWLEIVSE